MDNLSVEEKFRAAVHLIRNLPKKGSFQPSNETMLKFYSYYKQATEGPCKIPKPSFWDIVNKAKWEAWKSLGDMPKEQAMEHYVDELSKVIQTTSFTERADDFMQVVGPFSELIPDQKESSQQDPQLNGDVDSDEENFEKSFVDESVEIANSIGAAEVIAKQLKVKKYETDNRDLHSRLPLTDGGTSEALNGHNTSGNDDSESDEFSDTCDQIERDDDMEPVHLILDGTYSLERLQAPVWNTNSKHSGMQSRGGGDQQPGSSSGDKNPGSSGGRQARVHSGRGTHPEIFRPHHPHSNGAGGSGSQGGGRGGGSQLNTSIDLGAQLALAVIKLQHTMEEVVSRLDSLEMLLQNRQSNGNKQDNAISQWTLLGLSPKALLLLIIWPFVTQWIIFIVRRHQRH